MTRISSKWSAFYKIAGATAPFLLLAFAASLLLLATVSRNAVTSSVSESQVPFLIFFAVLQIGCASWSFYLWRKYYRHAVDLFQDGDSLVVCNGDIEVNRIPFAKIISEEAPFGPRMAIRVLQCSADTNHAARIVYFPPLKTCYSRKTIKPEWPVL